MDSNNNYFHAICPHLPEKLLHGLRSTPVDDLALDNLVRLISGSEPSSHSTPDVLEGWPVKQASIASILSSLTRPSDTKRALGDSESDPATKRPRLSPPESSTPNEANFGRLLFSFKPISTTSPVRKKVEINILEKVLVLVNAATKTTEFPPIPLSTLRRAFLLPTRGKMNPHWTVVILSSDSQTVARGKQSKATQDDNPQVIFGIDAKLSTPITTVNYDAGGDSTTTVDPKGSEALRILRAFVERLGIPLIEPDAGIFKSAVPGLGKNANLEGVPGIEAYRSAKLGTLWFMREGILWGESKPCEFWAVEDLIGKTEGLRIIGGTGKTCSVILTRRSRSASSDSNKDTSAGETGTEENEGDLGEETEFSMVDSKEKEGIESWVKRHRHLFGGAQGTSAPGVEEPETGEIIPKGHLTIHHLGDKSDSSDEDFTMNSDSEPSGSGTDSEPSDEDAEGEDEDESQDGEGSASAEDDKEEEELDPKRHPLLRAGPLPRMSKGVMDAAIGMMMGDLAGDSEEEVDELMD